MFLIIRTIVFVLLLYFSERGVIENCQWPLFTSFLEIWKDTNDFQNFKIDWANEDFEIF